MEIILPGEKISIGKILLGKYIFLVGEGEITTSEQFTIETKEKKLIVN